MKRYHVMCVSMA